MSAINQGDIVRRIQNIEDPMRLDVENQLEVDRILRESGVGFNLNVVRADITVADQAAFDAWNAANPDDQWLAVSEAYDTSLPQSTSVVGPGIVVGTAMY